MSKGCKRFLKKSRVEFAKKSNEKHNRTMLFELNRAGKKEVCYPLTTPIGLKHSPGEHGWCYSTPWKYRGPEPTWGYCSFQCALNASHNSESVQQVQQRSVMQFQVYLVYTAPILNNNLNKLYKVLYVSLSVLSNEECKDYQSGEIFLPSVDMCAARINKVHQR